MTKKSTKMKVSIGNLDRVYKCIVFNKMKPMKKPKYAIIDAETGEIIDTFRYCTTPKSFIKNYDKKIKEGTIKLVKIEDETKN